jgi:hypothetical protein
MVDNTRTDLEIGADVRLAGTDWRLKLGFGREKKFTLTPVKPVEPLDVANALFTRSTHQQGDLFQGDIFPKIKFKQLDVIYEPSAGNGSRAIFRASIGTGSTLIKNLDFLFAKLEEDGQSRYLAGIGSETSISLVSQDAGVVGQLLGNVALDRLGLYYASHDVASFSVPGTDKRRNFPSSLSVSLGLSFRESHLDISLSSAGLEFSGPAAPALPGPSPAPDTPPPELPSPAKAQLEKTKNRFWKDLNKTLGPLQLRRIGGEWDGTRLGLLLDATIELMGLSLGLSGLALKVNPSKLSDFHFPQDLEFGLDGLSLAFQRGPVSISGALLKTIKGGQTGFAGLASIRTAAFSIGAIGAYSTTEVGNQPSFFIYGAFTGILAGPPCFVVQGIAAGFGYNRAITLPDIDGVREFPLVSLVLAAGGGGSANPVAPAGGGGSSDPLEQLSKLDQFPAVPGQYWIAAGLKFTSFKLIEAFALLTVQFGTRFEIALLGVATLRQPPPPAVPTLIQVELALKVRFAPDDGLLSVMAALTANSYLFDTRCKLTGGFALCIWFPPTDTRFDNHAGDFVVTLGGYHPKFNVPAHYPKVPRVGFNWQLPECGVAIKGEAYFALTPSFIMAGARLSAVFRSGDFSAWFEAYADFLIGWAPLHYEAEIGMRIGAAYVCRIGEITFTLSFELSAQLQIWGPPFAGEAYIDLGIIAFTVPLGDRNAPRKPPEVSWSQFAGQFLPAEWLGITISAGVLEEHKGTAGGKDYTIVNPSELRLTVESFVPVTDVTVAPELPPAVKAQLAPKVNGKLGIRPMGKTTFDSSLALTCNTADMDYEAVKKNVPEALWSSAPMPDRKQPQLPGIEPIKDVLMGVHVLPRASKEAARVSFKLKINDIQVPLAKRPTQDVVDAPYILPSSYRDQFLKQWKPPAEAKEDVLTALRTTGFDIPEDAVDLARTASNPLGVWLAPPPLIGIGQRMPEHGY